MKWNEATDASVLDAPALEVADSDWVRLVPIHGPEHAKVDAVPMEHDARGRPLPVARPIDRKLVAAYDLMGDRATPPRMYASERFVRALESLRLPGWRAHVVRHITPNAVHGHRLFHLELDGWIGPFVDTELKSTAPHPDFPDEQPNGLPVDPVRFDATRGSGHPLAWSSWCGIRDSEWRALLCSGAVLRALNETLGRVRCGVTPVEVRGFRAGAGNEPGRIEADDPPPHTWTIDEALARARAGAARFEHRFGGAAAVDVERALRDAGVSNVAEMGAAYARMNGASLFRGALAIFPLASLRAQREEAESLGCYAIEPGAVPFAKSVDQTLWAMMPDGRVRAYAQDGLVYGPDAPFASWLGDQIADLEYAWDHGQGSWRIRALEG